MKHRIFFLLLALSFSAYAQEPKDPPINPPIEQQLENLTESGDDVETEDDQYLQDMQQFLKDPIDINTAGESELRQLRVLNQLQIQSLLSYRNLFGQFINMYELQAVPGLSIAQIQKIRAYLTVSPAETMLASFSRRFGHGDHSILARVTQVLEQSKGFRLDTSASSYYPGSPQKLFIRYKYVYKNLLQYGFTAEKDAGEQFFKGHQTSGFDFYSAHFFLRNLGNIKSLTIGDFTLNLGQGLVQWMGLAFKKSSDVINIKRQADVLRQYNSAGEIYFHRGAGITVQKDHIEATVFGSYRNLDANFIPDTLNNEDYVSSLQTSGFHRTKNEVADKNIQRQLSFGGNLAYNKSNLHLGVNSIWYNFKLPIVKSTEPYNRYALGGDKWGNYSIDYSYTYRNMHFFGEAAGDKNFNKAFVNGLMISTDARVDMSLLYRNISSGYQSLYTNAFTESTFPNNERGLYSGISITPVDILRFDAYMDLYSFPWLRYRVDAPTSGNDYLVQVTYKPNKQVEIYSRYRSERKAINYNPDELPSNPVVLQPRQSWRTQFNYKATTTLTFRSRVELLWFDKRGNAAESGFLTFADLLFKPLLQPFSGNIRLQYFETGGYNSRMYAYENDVLYSFSIPVFYDKGYRYYINLNYDVSKKLAIWFRIAQTFYPDKNVIGSGLDEILGHHKTEVKMQVIKSFGQ